MNSTMTSTHSAGASGSYILAGVMGWPVAHSRSPLIHGHWLRHYGLKGDYVLLPVQPERLGDALRGLSALGFAGCNLTLPHKIAAMQLVDRVDPLAARMGAINTIAVEEDGTLTGFNNDAYGFIQSLLEAQPGLQVRTATVLGAGGAARAVLAALAEHGAEDIRICNRSHGKAQDLAAEFGSHFRTQFVAVPWENREAALAGCDLLVNTTSLGMKGQDTLEIRLDALPAEALVSDAIYVPLETPLLTAARARGHVTVGGLGMLLHQARPAFERWFGVRPEITPELRRAIEATL